MAALNRPESLGFVVAVGVPALVLSDRDRGETLRGLAVLGGVVLLVVAPWLVRNERQVGGVTMATNSGKTLLGSNCDGAFEGPGLGGFDYECQFGAAAFLVEVGPPDGGTWDGRRFDDVLGEAGREFIREHRNEVPRVVAARIARMWGLAFAADQLAFDVSEGRHRPSQQAGQWLHLVLLPFVAAGAVLGFRRRRAARTIILLGHPRPGHAGHGRRLRRHPHAQRCRTGAGGAGGLRAGGSRPGRAGAGEPVPVSGYPCG